MKEIIMKDRAMRRHSKEAAGRRWIIALLFSPRKDLWKMGWNWFRNIESVWRWRMEGTSTLALSSMEKENNFSFSLHLMSQQRWIQYTFVIQAADCVLKPRLFFASSSSPFPFFPPFQLIFCPFLLKSQAAFYLKPSFILSIFASLRQPSPALSESFAYFCVLFQLFHSVIRRIRYSQSSDMLE